MDHNLQLYWVHSQSEKLAVLAKQICEQKNPFNNIKSEVSIKHL